MEPVTRASKGIYERPYLLIFLCAAMLSAHGLHESAHKIGRIPAELAWLFIVIIDALGISAFRTWRQATAASRWHWAGGVAAAAAALTVCMNVFSSFPQLAATWMGPLIAATPPIAAFFAAALRMQEQRLRSVTAGGGGIDRPKPTPAPEPVDEPEPQPAPKPATPVTPEPEPAPKPAPEPTARPRLTAIPAVTGSSDADVAAIVAEFLNLGGTVTDPGLTTIVAEELGCSDRTARRKLQRFREGVAA
jgi:hypothetical protein